MSNQGPKGPQPPAHIPLPRSRRGLKSFFGDVSREMKKVTWPPVHETNRLTGVVMAVCLLLIGIMLGFHMVASEVINLLLKGF